MKDRSARGWMDETDEVAPCIAMLDRSQGTLPVDTPDLVQKRFQADAVLVDCLQLDDTVRERRGNFAEEWAQPRLEGGLRHGICLDMTGAWLEKTRSDLP